MNRYAILLGCATLAVTCAPVSGQAITVTSSNIVNSPFTAQILTPTTKVAVAGQVVYDTNLSPASLYVGATQLAADVQSFFNAYPSPTDPIEAIASSVMTQLLQKYPQINGGVLNFTVVPLTNPLNLTVTSVYMGTLGHSQTSSEASKLGARSTKP